MQIHKTDIECVVIRATETEGPRETYRSFQIKRRRAPVFSLNLPDKRVEKIIKCRYVLVKKDWNNLEIC